MRCVFFGDSIAAGCRAVPGQGWVDLLAARLPEIEAVNAGVNGETTQDALKRLDKDVLRRSDNTVASAPDVVYVQFGLNDASWWCRQVGRSWVKQADFIANMQQIAQRCRDSGVSTVLVGVNHPVPESASPQGEPTYSGTVQEYNAALRKAFAEGPEILVDMEAAFNAHGNLQELLDADGLHLSPKGNALYAETVEGVFRKKFAFLI